MITAGSVFTGIGGMDLGLERAGIRTLWQIEKQAFRRKVLAVHWPETQRLGDVTHADPDQLRAIDLLHGGFPCQDVSVAGRRAGLAGERSGLFFEFVRLAAALRPRWLLIENVPGLLSSNEGRDMGTVVGTLADLGYGWAYRMLDAQYFALAQRRPRVLIVGCLGDAASAAAVLFEPDGGEGHPAPRRVAKEELAAPVGANATGGDRFDLDLDTYVPVARPLVPGDTLDGTIDTYVPVARPILTEDHYDEEQDTFVVAPGAAGSLTSAGESAGRALDDDYNLVGIIQDARGSSASKQQHGVGVSGPRGPMYALDAEAEHAVAFARSHANVADQGETWHEIDKAVGLQSVWSAQHEPVIVENRPGEVSTSDLAHAINAENDGSREPMVVAGGVRRLTMLERERLQGLPDGHTCLCGAAHEYRAVLRVVWEIVEAEGVSEREARMAFDAGKEALLQLAVRQTASGKPRGGDSGFWTEACSAAVSAATMLTVRVDAANTSAPPRREPAEQRSGEHPLPVREVSRDSALGRRSAGGASSTPANHGQGQPWADCRLDGLTMLCTCKDAPRRRAIGDAVPTNLAEWVGRRLIAVEERGREA